MLPSNCSPRFLLLQSFNDKRRQSTQQSWPSAYRGSAPSVRLHAAPRDFTEGKGGGKKGQEDLGGLTTPVCPWGKHHGRRTAWEKKQQTGFLLLCKPKEMKKHLPGAHDTNWHHPVKKKQQQSLEIIKELGRRQRNLRICSVTRADGTRRAIT